MDQDKTVYLADDDEDDRYLFKEAVEKTNEKVKIVESDSGEELIQQLKESSDDLSKVVVVVDHNMPAMTGLETIAAIKSDPEITEVHTVMMSTSSNPVLKSNSIDAGADLFITKPFSFKELVETVKKILNSFFR